MAECIILAGGKSTRMGTNKMLLDYKGHPLLWYTIQSVRPFVNRIIVVTGKYDQEIREALKESIDSVLDAIHVTLERTPPELAADIIEQGITLTGGGALLRGLDKLVNQETGMPVYVAERPLDCVVDGTGMVLENIDKLRDVLSE